MIVRERLTDKNAFLQYMKEADEKFKELIEDHLGENIGPREDPIVLQQGNGGRLLMFRCDGRTFDYDLNQWVVDESARAPLQREEHNKFCWLKGNRALFFARSFADFFTYIDHCKRTEVAKELLTLSRDVIFYYENFGEHLSTLTKLEDKVNEILDNLAILSFTKWLNHDEFITQVVMHSRSDLAEEDGRLTLVGTLCHADYVLLKGYTQSKYRLDDGMFNRVLGICVLHAICVVMKHRLENSELSVVSDKTRKLTDGEMAVANFLVENYKKERNAVLGMVDKISKLLSPKDMSDTPVELVELEKMCRTLGVLRVEYELN